MVRAATWSGCGKLGGLVLQTAARCEYSLSTLRALLLALVLMAVVALLMIALLMIAFEGFFYGFRHAQRDIAEIRQISAGSAEQEDVADG